MSYVDRTKVRNKPVKARFNPKEFDALRAIAELNDREPAVYVRELILAHIGYGSTENHNGNNNLQGPQEGLWRLRA